MVEPGGTRDEDSDCALDDTGVAALSEIRAGCIRAATGWLARIADAIKPD
jgi:hypothetical protein